jgi:hypothetical protein
MLASIALSLTGFAILFSGLAMPEEDTLFSYTASLVCLLPLAAAHLNSFFRTFGFSNGLKVCFDRNLLIFCFGVRSFAKVRTWPRF